MTTQQPYDRSKPLEARPSDNQAAVPKQFAPSVRAPGSVESVAPAPTTVQPPWAATWRIVVLFVAMFLGPWAVWFSRIAEGQGTISWHLPLGVALWTITPTLAVALLITGGRQALADVGSRLIRWRVPKGAYLCALLLPPLVAIITIGIAVATGVHLDLGGELSATGSIIYLFIGLALFLLTEEAGWRGAILPRLQTRLAPLAATIILGTIWTAWHIPSFHVPGEQDKGTSVPVFFVLVLATSVLITTLVNAAGGSVLIAALFHASFDASYAFTGVVGGDPALLVIATAITALAAGVVIWRTRATLTMNMR